LHVQMGIPYLPSLLLAVAFGFVLGALTNLIAFRPLKNANVISLVLATIGIAFMLRGTARVTWGGKGDYLPFPPITSPEPVMIGDIMVSLSNSQCCRRPRHHGGLRGLLRLTRAGKMMQATRTMPRQRPL